MPNSTTSLIQTILLDEELNRNIADDGMLNKALHIGFQIHEAMCKGISKQEAFELLDQYDEACNEIHESEKEYWLKVGIRMGYEFYPIINHPSHQ